MLFSSLVAISYAAYNFPKRAVIIRAVWMACMMWKWRLGGEGQLKEDFSQWINAENCFCIRMKLDISWHLNATRWSQQTVNRAQPVSTHWGWGTWAALFFCTHLEETWRSRPLLSASPRRSGWGSCRCGWSGSSPADPAPWPHLGGGKHKDYGYTQIAFCIKRKVIKGKPGCSNPT